MSDEVEITLSYPWDGHEVGDRVMVDATQAKALVRGGVALYATVKDATAAGADADQAASRRKS
jgi:hypothetical protein